MEEAIVGKLRALLRGGINMEAELVYLLVEIRKLYESRNATLPPYLALFCDWVVHAKLTHKKWAKYGPEMLEADSTGRAPKHAPNVEFRRSLAGVLCAEGLTEPDWPRTQQLLAMVLTDCPLEFTGEPYQLTVEPYPGRVGGWVLSLRVKPSDGCERAPSEPLAPMRRWGARL